MFSNGGMAACFTENYIGNSRANHPRPQPRSQLCSPPDVFPLLSMCPVSVILLLAQKAPYLLGQALTTAKSAPLRGLHSSLRSHPPNGILKSRNCSSSLGERHQIFPEPSLLPATRHRITSRSLRNSLCMLGSEDATQIEGQEKRKILHAQLECAEKARRVQQELCPPVEAVSHAALYTPVLVTQLSVYPQLDN